jgi:predicted RNase H-like HicB family nuclease
MSTTRKPKGDAAKAKGVIDRPFDREVLAEATRVAQEYQVTVRFDREEGAWIGRCVELPLCIGVGKNPTECVRATREVMITAAASMIEAGERLPAPASDEQRTEQVNLRLTPSEKYRIEDAARRGGFRGISDYVRSAALK